jgi:tRNA threonylcarbamoyladenosine biosynthesis protein TsaB
MTENISTPILSIETSGEVCGASVYFEMNNYFEVIINKKNVHSEKIFEVIDRVLKLSGIKLNEVEAIAVSSGPGSFTGLRIGMSAAKGLAYGSHKPIIPVPTFEALALQLSFFIPFNAKFTICNKVNNNEVYLGGFISLENNYKIVDNIRVVKYDQIVKNLKNTDLIFGNAKVGDEYHQIHKNVTVPSPIYVAKWAYLFGKDLLTFNYDFLEPDYLKNFIVRQNYE